MRSWCYLCFTSDDDGEEPDSLPPLVKADHFIEDNNCKYSVTADDSNFGIDDGAVAIAFDNSNSYGETNRAPSLDSAMHGIVLPEDHGGSWRAQGESSSGSVVTPIVIDGKCDRDLHNKRAKVYSNSKPPMFGLEMNFFYNKFKLNNSSGSPFDSSGGRNDEDETDSSKSEEVEVRMDLIDDLLHKVFSFLDPINLCRAAMVCRQWQAANAHKKSKCLNFEKCNISLEQFEDMCRRYPNAIEVNIFGAPATHLLVMKAFSSLRNLEVLTLGKGQLGDPFFHALADCSMLKTLNVNDATLGNNNQEIRINHDRLRHLQLTKCCVARITVRCPQLETLSLKRSNMALAALICPLLRLLDIGSCHRLPDAAICSAATSCPQLESLDMSNCSCVSDETLREIAATCANLRILNASYCPNIFLESVRLTMLTSLKLHSCEGITSAADIAYSSMLEVLELDNCCLLTSVSLDLPCLQHISLVHCCNFADLNLTTIMLSSIMVSNCPALQRVNITSNSLQKLALQKQKNLTTLMLQCPCLQEVDLTDCKSLTDSICGVFSAGGGCPMLKSLVLDNCKSLKAVQFCSSTLISLSLVGCRAVTSLELTCPCLEEVCLDGYDYLEIASFCPVAVCSLHLGICPKLNTLKLEAPCMVSLELKGCGNLEIASFCPVALRSLNLGICPKLKKLKLKAPCMVSLELKGCGLLSEASIDCPLLTSLDASFCRQLKDDFLSATTASCPLIGSLILMSCHSVGSNGLYSLGGLKKLTVLDLSYTFLVSLQPVFESCLHLKVLKLQACKDLTDTSLEPLYKQGALSVLQELDLSYGTFCQSAIEKLLAFCTHLTHLSLIGCVNMHDLSWGTTAGQLSESIEEYGSSPFFRDDASGPGEQPNRLLQNLNCVGCPNIRKVFIPPIARCVHLSSLNLSLAANLKEVDITCFRLCVLNLSRCSALEILKLNCPRLSSLFLQSCNIDEEAVASAILQCSMLETLDVRHCPKICSEGMVRLRTARPSLKRVFSKLSA